MRKPAFIFLLFLVLAAETLQAQMGYKRNINRTPRVNVGVKAGFNSTVYSIKELSIGNIELDNVQNNYKVGYFATLFCRFNLRSRHFIQPEFTYNISKGSISIGNTPDNSEYLAGNALIRTTIQSFEVPLLYGYKFVDTYPYGMAFFIGPKIACTWKDKSKSEFEGFHQQDIQEWFYPINFSGVFGLAANISNIFFDLRYEFGLKNMTENITFNPITTESPHAGEWILINRRKNVISFSLGVIF